MPFDERDYERPAALELAEREQAIAAAKQPPVEEPLEVDGVRYCLGCDEPIDRRRLAAWPAVVRCVECEEDKARRARR